MGKCRGFCFAYFQIGRKSKNKKKSKKGIQPGIIDSQTVK